MFESLFETIAAGVNLSAEQADFIKSLWTPRQFRKGQFFERIGDITSAVTGQPTLYAVDAIEPSTALTIDLASFNQMLERFPDIARGYRLGLQRSQGAQQRRIAMSLSATAEERYADFVARHPALAARVPQRMLASYLGIAPETLSRIRRTTREP